jgi:RNA polymerase sigma-54 factor
MLKQSLKLKLAQRLSPQQIQMMKLLQLSTIEFEQKLKQEIEENPALESDNDFEVGEDEQNNLEDFSNQDDFEDNQTIDTQEVDIDVYISDDETPSYKTNINNYSTDDEYYEVQQSVSYSLTEYLCQQLYTFDLTKQALSYAEFLVGNIEEDGYIRRPLSSIIDDYAMYHNFFIPPTQLEEILTNYIQKLEPTGIGARDLKECLMIQLNHKTENINIKIAKTLLSHYFDEFAKKKYQQIIQKLEISEEQLKQAIQEITKLNPKPGKAFSTNSFGNNPNLDSIIPDFMLGIENNELQISLNNRNIPQLKISYAYQEMLQTYKNTKKKSKDQRNAVLFIKQKLDSAKGFIEMAQQRQQTLWVFIHALVNFQKEYFLSGDERDLKPMIMKDIAEKSDMAVSTISRLVNNKYISTPYGTKKLKELFSEGMKNDEGEDISTKEIKNVLAEIIDNEDKKNPVTDEKLLLLLKEKGFTLARRTIAKYREQLNIPVARLRKELC